MMISLESDKGETYTEALNKLAGALHVHVIPLFSVPPGKRPALVGTALLVKHLDRLYVVSARHVLDQALHPRKLYFYDQVRALRRLSGVLIRTSPLPEEASDIHDLAVMRLPRDTPESFLEGTKQPISSELLLPFRTDRLGQQYLVTGFPRSKSNADPSSYKLKSQVSSFRVVSAKEESYTLLGVSTKRHVVMPLNVDQMVYPDGRSSRIPDPHGMSGSPVWLISDSVRSFELGHVPIVGIVIEYHKAEKLLVATDVGVALDLISASYD